MYQFIHRSGGVTVNTVTHFFMFGVSLWRLTFEPINSFLMVKSLFSRCIEKQFDWLLHKFLLYVCTKSAHETDFLSKVRQIIILNYRSGSIEPHYDIFLFLVVKNIVAGSDRDPQNGLF